MDLEQKRKERLRQIDLELLEIARRNIEEAEKEREQQGKNRMKKVLEVTTQGIGTYIHLRLTLGAVDGVVRQVACLTKEAATLVEGGISLTGRLFRQFFKS